MDLTTILRRMQAGEEQLSGELFASVYDEMRAMARQRMALERKEHTLQATALVHETYVRLMGDPSAPWANRAHFFAAATEAMRRILIEHARAKGRVKRGGDRLRVPLESADLAQEMDVETILAVDEAIRRMEEDDKQTAQVVRLRFYAGLSVDETALVLNVSARTVMRDWSYARAWLFRVLGGEEHGQGENQGGL